MTTTLDATEIAAHHLGENDVITGSVMPWDLREPAPPRYAGDDSVYSPACPDANGVFVLGRRIQGVALNQDGDGEQVAMHTFLPDQGQSAGSLEAFELMIKAYCDHAQQHPGILAQWVEGNHAGYGALTKQQGSHYYIRGDYRDLQQLAVYLDHDATIMCDVTPAGTVIHQGQPREHMRIVVPFKEGTPNNTVGECALQESVLDTMLTVLSGQEGRLVTEHADFNGIHMSITTTSDVITRLMPIVRTLGAIDDIAEHLEHDQQSQGATRFVTKKTNFERYNVTAM